MSWPGTKVDVMGHLVLQALDTWKTLLEMLDLMWDVRMSWSIEFYCVASACTPIAALDGKTVRVKRLPIGPVL